MSPTTSVSAAAWRKRLDMAVLLAAFIATLSACGSATDDVSPIGTAAATSSVEPSISAGSASSPPPPSPSGEEPGGAGPATLAPTSAPPSTTSAPAAATPQSTMPLPVTEPLLELMQVQSGGGTNDGCFGLDQDYSVDPTGFHVDAGFAVEYGDRVQLCLAGFETSAPVQIAITAPTGEVATLDATLAPSAQPSSSPPNWFDFAPDALEAVTFTPYQGGSVLESPFRPVDTGMPPGDYLIAASQGSAQATSMLTLAPTLGQHSPTVLQTGPTTYRVTVASSLIPSLEVGLYTSAGFPTVTAELVRSLGVAVLNEHGVASIDFDVADVPPGEYCVLTIESTACVNNELVL